MSWREGDAPAGVTLVVLPTGPPISTIADPTFFDHAIHASIPAFCCSGVDFIICSKPDCDALYSTRNFFMLPSLSDGRRYMTANAMPLFAVAFFETHSGGLATLWQQRCDLGMRQLAPAPERQLAELDVHDAHALQRLDRVSECLAHAADLPVQPLHQDDPKHLRPEREHLARLGRRVGEPHPSCHLLDKLRRDRLVDAHHVFLLVAVLGAQHLVDDVAVVREQDQP